MTDFEVKLLTVLGEIRDVLAVAWLEREPERPPAGCQHPKDRRVDFGMTQGQPDWECRDCGHRSVVEVTVG